MEKPVLKSEIEAKIISVGKVEDNILDAKNYALNLKEYYSKLVFTEEQKSEAEKERANINKTIKKIAEYRKSIIAEFKKPIELFETTAKETEKILEETSGFVDTQIKNFESKEKEERKENARKIYNENIEELKDIVSFDKIFNEKWLNKGTWKDDNTSPTIENEINEIKEKVRNGFKAIEELNSEFELELKNSFLQDFDITKAIFKNNELKKQKEKLESAEQIKEKIEQEKVEIDSLVDPILTYTLKITAPLTKQKELRKFLENNNIKFEKIESEDK